MSEVLTCKCGCQSWIISSTVAMCSECNRRVFLLNISLLNEKIEKESEQK